MSNNAKRDHGRSPGKCAITVSMTEDLRDQINKAAKAERRTRSNWIVNELEIAVRRQHQELLVAEAGGKYETRNC